MMTATRELKTKSGITLREEINETDDHIEVSLIMIDGTDCLLHWGLLRRRGGEWNVPPGGYSCEGSREAGKTAIQTPFKERNGERSLSIRLDKDTGFSLIAFALYFPDTDRWDSNRGRNYHIELPRRKGLDPLRVLKEKTGEAALFEKSYSLESGDRLAVAVTKVDGLYRVELVSDGDGNLMLHWGIAGTSRHEWALPPQDLFPAATERVSDVAAETPFVREDDLMMLTFEFREEDAPPGITFVLRQKETDQWLKDGRRNFYIPLSRNEEEYPGLSRLTDEIIHAEMGDHSWTLMHRFNLCHDLLDDMSTMDELTLLVVWIRFSALRQLDWQRRYNTKPRELSHAQDRLTLRLARMYIQRPEFREFLRLIMSSVGKGGEGQKVRDEILHIMHRHHIKEVAGHFMEEWHQKLHNNTTPDDIVICEAYLEFMRREGDIEAFYKTLEEGGVTRERLESFDRPIVSEPDFIPRLKDALIHDFGAFLRLLRSVHSGTDLESSIDSARYLFDDELSAHLDFVWRNREKRGVPVTGLVERITAARRKLIRRLDTEADERKTRDMLYLDLSLEEFLRVIIERHIHEKFEEDKLIGLVDLILENVRFSRDSDELSACNGEWSYLKDRLPLDHDRALHAKAALDRIRRAIGAFVDHFYKLLQPKAEYLGKAFHASAWTITLFTEEVVRGQPAFVLSIIIHHLDPLLRQRARLGKWQVISPGEAVGRIEVVETLRSLQGKRFDTPSILVADIVKGDEEPPEGVAAVVTPDDVDLVSHVAVRARNAHLLFATCFDMDCVESLKSQRGRIMKFSVNAAGDVVYEETGKETTAERIEKGKKHVIKPMPEFSAFVVTQQEFHDGIVGGKSGNLNRLVGALPEWIHLPRSVALPFPVFDRVLSWGKNRDVATRYRELLKDIPENPEERLLEIRTNVLSLEAPGELMSDLCTVMDTVGLAWPDRWDEVWTSIKRVWASKWNDRAYLSREGRGIHHEDILMAVLIQEVVNAEYAFVIHTANPFTGDGKELYAEAVPGLGETLVGNFPGRAFSFTVEKKSMKPSIMAYPSKSIALYGDGLIFRSDSNAEDLPGYAGAGLYDSVMLDPPREMIVHYIEHPLVWDETFKNKFMDAVTRIGLEIEEHLGTPQDIEGAYSGGEYHVVQTRPQVGLLNE